MVENSQSTDPFFVSAGDDLVSGLICGLPRFWSMVGNAESRFFAEEIEAVRIDRPVYITGLPRGGTTILLEALATVPGIATHRYLDFPLVLAPLVWQRLLKHMPMSPVAATERAHGDGMMVTPESPEAMEEVVWMAFFDQLHGSGQSQVLDAGTENSRFARFYRDHIRKLLWARGADRYVSKGNYNITRLAYLRRLFPDARFVVPVRSPETHIASLIKQQTLFAKYCTGNPRARRHLGRVGHFEFGPDRRAINAGDAAKVREIETLWAEGDEVRGWARYWASIYRFVLGQLDADPALRAATKVVRYEDLCADPVGTLRWIGDHCGIDDPNAALASFAQRIQAPTYYRPNFSDHDREIIQHETGETAEQLGYADAPATSA